MVLFVFPVSVIFCHKVITVNQAVPLSPQYAFIKAKKKEEMEPHKPKEPPPPQPTEWCLEYEPFQIFG